MNPIIEYHRIAGSLDSDKLHSLNAYLVGAYLILSPEHWGSAIKTVRELMSVDETGGGQHVSWAEMPTGNTKHAPGSMSGQCSTPLPVEDGLVETGAVGENPDLASALFSDTESGSIEGQACPVGCPDATAKE